MSARGIALRDSEGRLWLTVYAGEGRGVRLVHPWGDVVEVHDRAALSALRAALDQVDREAFCSRGGAQLGDGSFVHRCPTEAR